MKYLEYFWELYLNTENKKRLFTLFAINVVLIVANIYGMATRDVKIVTKTKVVTKYKDAPLSSQELLVSDAQKNWIRITKYKGKYIPTIKGKHPDDGWIWFGVTTDGNQASDVASKMSKCQYDTYAEAENAAVEYYLLWTRPDDPNKEKK